MINVNIGDRVDTIRDDRSIGGTIHKVNSGKVERLTRTQVIVRNEHGNVQRFSREMGAAIPHVDRLCPTYMIFSVMPNPDKVENDRADGLDEYPLSCVIFTRKLLAAITKATKPARF